MNAIHREWLDSQAAQAVTPNSKPAPHAWRHDTHALGHNEVRVVMGGEAGEQFDTFRRFARTEDEAFRTPTWRNPVSGPHSNPNPIAEVLRWALVVVIALAMVGVTL